MTTVTPARSFLRVADLDRGEPLEDTARVLSRYAAALVVRTFAQADFDAPAGAASVR